jgi:hypothetical protein
MAFCVILASLSLHYVTCFLAFSVTENNKRQNFKGLRLDCYFFVTVPNDSLLITMSICIILVQTGQLQSNKL